MPWDCMSCKYQKHVKHQEGRIRYLELELKAAKDETDILKNRYMSNKIRDNDNTNDVWFKRKNSKSRAHRFSANNMSRIRLSNKFSVLEFDQQNPGLLKHKDMKTELLTGKSNSRKKKILLLGSSHGQDIGPLLQNHLGTECEVTSIFKPNASLENIVEDLANLGEVLTKKDHIVIVGGPGNNLERNHHYSIKKDLNFIARRTDYTVRFVNLLRRYDEPWMNKRARSVNLRLDRALLGHGMSHLGVTDTATIGREEYTAHGLHLNPRGKGKVMLLIADKLDGGMYRV